MPARYHGKKTNMKRLFVKIADSEHKRAQGLMFIKHMANNNGMLFKFPYAHYLRFWMKNTYIPLDIAFLNDNGEIFQISSMKALSTNAISSSKICRFALEVNDGWFKRNRVGIGSIVAGEGITHRKGSQIKIAQISNNVDGSPTTILDDTYDSDNGQKQPDMNNIYTLPWQENEGDMPEEEGADQENLESEHFQDIRAKIKYANDHNKQMEIVYWTLKGNVLPPRKLAPIPDEGYTIKPGPNGNLLVAFDISPSISGNGWIIPGMQIKNFLMDNIISLEIVD